MKPNPSPSTFKGVFILWLVIVVAFLGFNSVYWPVVSYQAAVDPDRFIERAQDLYALGQYEAAIDWLRRGIETHHPPTVQPYELLYKWSSLQNRALESRPLKAQVSFYRAWREAQVDARGILLENAVSDGLAIATLPAVARETADAMDGMSLFLAEQFGLRELVSGWPPARRMALLALSGGPFCHDRLIGNTGVHSPVDLVAFSGGGAGKTRVARFLCGTRYFEATRRGLHILLLDPESPENPVILTFDPWGAVDDAWRLADRLAAVPAGTIGAFAVMDNAASDESRVVDEALLAFGLIQEAVVNREPVLIGERFSFAAIGVKDAPRGSGIQAWSPGRFEGSSGHPVAVGVVQQRDGGQ